MTGDGPAAAVAALSAALGADPGRGDLWSELAIALVAAGRAREAWDAAVRGVQVAPQLAASHRAIGTVAAALNDSRQAESAYRHALLLDPSDHETQTALSRLARPEASYPDPSTGSGRRRAPGPVENPPSGRRRAPEPDPLPDPPPTGRRRAPDLDPLPDPPPTGRRRAPDLDPLLDPLPAGRRAAAPDPLPDPLPTGRRRAPEPDQPGTGRRRAPDADPPLDSTPSGRRRAPEPDPLLDPFPTGRRRAPEPDQPPPARGGRRRAPEPPEPTAAPPFTTTAVGFPAWLTPAPYDPLTPPVPTGATRVAPASDGWRPALIAVVRIEWMLTVACYVGLVSARVAPYTAGALAGLAVVLGAYGRLRWQSARTRRPPPRDRPATALAIAAAVATIVVVPAAMLGALTAARGAAIAAVTCATVAAVLLRRTSEPG